MPEDRGVVATPIDTKRPGLAVPLAIVLLAGCVGPDSRREVVVFAAASLQDALRELSAGFETRERVSVAFNFAGSNTLARQIEAANVADLFLSADERWMDELDRAGLIDRATRTTFATNTLVLVARDDAAVEAPSLDALASAPLGGLVLADPESVPAGRYARRALERVELGGSTLWDRVRDAVVPAADARAALALIASDPELVGIVYATDVRPQARIRVLCSVPADPSAPIRYVGAVTASAAHPVDARAFLDQLAGPDGQAVLDRHGFGSAQGVAAR